MSTGRNTATRDKHRAALRAAGANCGICGLPIDYSLANPHPKSFVVDHIIPLVRGGSDEITNKQAAHRDCNRSKGDKHFAPVVKRSGSLT